MQIVTRRLAFTALALLLAACSATSPVSPAGTPADATATVSASPAPPASALFSPTPAPLPSPRSATRGGDWEWRDVWFENPLGLSPSLTGVIFTGAGFLAWGPNAVGSAMATSSSDLGGWQGGDSRPFVGVRLIGIAYAPAGIVALGTDKAGVVHAWRSTDGTTWKAGPAQTGIDGTVHTIVSFIGGLYYAAGTAKGGCDVAIWTSSDGFAWRPSEPLSGARGTCTTGASADVPAIKILREGVAYGSVPGIGNAFWTSTDRVHWTFHPQPSLGGTIVGLAGMRTGFVAVGDTGSGGAAVWLSPDGATWTAAPDQTALHDANMSDVRTLDDGSLVAIGGDHDNAFVSWTSTDGLAWVRGPAPLNSSGGPLDRPAHPLGWVLASDGHGSSSPSERLIAVAGGSRAMVSPPTTPDLREGSMTVSLSGRVDLSTQTVAGACRQAEDGTTSTAIRVALPNLGTPNPADVYVVVTPDGRITDFQINTDGLSVGVGAAQPIDPSTFTIAPGSTPAHGSAEFRDLVDILSPAGSKLLSGSVAWTCSGS